MRSRVSSRSPYESVIGFSRAVRVGNQVFVAGTAPIGSDRKTFAPGDPYGQAKRCLEIIVTALAELGADPRHVVRTRTFLKNPTDWEAVGRAHGEVFGEAMPASTMVVANLLDPEWLVEIEADAILD